MADEFQKAFKKVQSTVNTANRQALSRAATSTRARLAKEVSANLGIPSKTVKDRTKIIKGLNAIIMSIGVKVQLAASAFKTYKIQVQSSRGLRIGALADIKSKGRVIVPQAVIIKGKNSGKPIVVTNIGGHKYKTARVDGVFEQAVRDVEPVLEQHMYDRFKIELSNALNYLLNK